MRVAGVFFSQPTRKHYLKEISVECGLAHTSVKCYLETLKKESIIKESSEKRGERTFPLYSANLSSDSYKRQKTINNIIRILDSGLIRHITDKTVPNSIILFGSYSRGEDTEDSDIDLFVEAKNQDLDVREFEGMLDRRIQIHFKEDISMYPKELKNSIINGFTLFGSIEVFK